MTENNDELREILTGAGPIYSKSDKSIIELIDSFLWGNKKLTFYLIESIKRIYSDEGTHAKFHIYLEDADSQKESDEPIFTILDTTHLNRAKDLWLKLQKLKDCLLGPDSK